MGRDDVGVDDADGDFDVLADAGVDIERPYWRVGGESAFWGVVGDGDPDGRG